MTDEEARAVAKALGGIHGECYFCASLAAEELGRSLPDRDWFQLVADESGHWTRESLVDRS